MHQTERALKRLLFALAVTLCAAVPSMADTYTYSAQTLPTGPFFRRPVETGDAFSPLVDRFGFPILTAYHVSAPFSVSLGGSYTFSSQQFDFDGFLILYRAAFVPANGLLNFVAADDDAPGGVFGTSLFSTTLATNTFYLLITTGYNEPDFGRFINTITGPGIIQPIPEPATMILFGTGLASAVGAMRRRRKNS